MPYRGLIFYYWSMNMLSISCILHTVETAAIKLYSLWIYTFNADDKTLFDFKTSSSGNIHIQGISEKCTGAFNVWCRVIFYPKACLKSCLISLSIYQIQTKMFISMILNEHNDPCFEEKSSSFTEISSATLFRMKLYLHTYLLFSS